jgi:hypothetical protein
MLYMCMNKQSRPNELIDWKVKCEIGPETSSIIFWNDMMYMCMNKQSRMNELSDWEVKFEIGPETSSIIFWKWYVVYLYEQSKQNEWSKRLRS